MDCPKKTGFVTFTNDEYITSKFASNFAIQSFHKTLLRAFIQT